jgi:hypothetical protein
LKSFEDFDTAAHKKLSPTPVYFLQNLDLATERSNEGEPSQSERRLASHFPERMEKRITQGSLSIELTNRIFEAIYGTIHARDPKLVTISQNCSAVQVSNKK